MFSIFSQLLLEELESITVLCSDDFTDCASTRICYMMVLSPQGDHNFLLEEKYEGYRVFWRDAGCSALWTG